ncbi:MAG: DNA-binding response regulator [Campylobacterales bacterium 16-40-21]|nr:MAG: DNA-binding response regulator [Campylobacterales bacterium 16-40-21]
MRVLLIEDDKKISDYLAQGLKESGYIVDLCLDGEEGFDYLSTYTYDLVVLDLMLPKMDGFTLITKIRHLDAKIPILILSAKRSVADRIKGLQLGGDDYLTKPFSFGELLARVQALLRRSTAHAMPTQNSIQLGDISMDLIARKVSREGEIIELQKKEFLLLEYFMRHPGCVLTKTQILEGVWDSQFDPQTNVVDVLVFRLRNKIDKNFEKKTISTLRGVGYIFEPN